MLYDECSDIHVEKAGVPDWKNLKNQDSNVLVIAGDVSDDISLTAGVVENAAKYYDKIVFVDGNHDNLYGDVDETTKFYQSKFYNHPNIIYLHGDNYYVFDDVAFIGITGWYDFCIYPEYTKMQYISAWGKNNDSKFINFGNYGTPDNLARIQSQKLADVVKILTVDSSIKQIVVTTHMAPKPELLEKSNDPEFNMITGSYCNTSMQNVLDADINNKIVSWNFGHTHKRSYRAIDNVLYVNNARGYHYEDSSEYFLAQVDTNSTNPYGF